MLALKINITKFITKEQITKIYQYSKLLAQCYNLCLTELRANNNFKNIYPITKQFQHKHKVLYSQHTHNVGKEAVGAVKSFYKKKKIDNKARYPKNTRQYSSIILDANKQIKYDKIYFGGGFKFIQNKIIKFTHPQLLLNLSNCDYFDSTKININTIKQIVIKIQNNQIYCIFIYSQPKQQSKQFNNQFISIDLGISSIASIYSSKGQCFKYQTKRMKSLEKNKDKIKSKLDRKKKYSKKYNKLKATLKKKQNKITNKRKDYLHKVSKHIINYCLNNQIDNIIIGDIETQHLVTKYNKGLNKSTQNEGLLSRFKSFINYKALNKGINVVMVNEAYTSQTNCLTGIKSINSDLSIRKVNLGHQFIVDRDLNSAVNIAKKYGACWSVHSFNKYSLLNVKEISSSELD